MVEPTKVCANPECTRVGERQPWSNFYSRTYWEDGSTRTVVSRCKPCHNAARMESFTRLPTSKAEAGRRYREKIATDPVRLANYQENQRFYSAGFRSRLGRRVGQRSTPSAGALLPVGPFAAWIESVMERDGLSRRDVAERLGMPERMVRLILNGGQSSVVLETVERALIADDGLTLRELYPELYVEAA